MRLFQKQAVKNLSPSEERSPCPYCGAAIGSGADACLRLVAQLAERARAEKDYAQAHLLSVDAHALQHPELHGRLSNHVHLLSLSLMLERGANASIDSRKPAVEKFLALGRDWPPLDPPPAGQRGNLTVRNVLDASPVERPLLARQWAEEVWQTWRPHHPWIRRMLDRLSHD
jgi:hypothetical protein